MQLLLSNLLLSLSVVTVAMLYLRGATRRVITDLCQSDSAAEFWLRSADILAYSGALMLVLMFGNFDARDWVDSLRLTLVLSLLGIFITVFIVLRKVWGEADPHKVLRPWQEGKP